MTTRRPMTFMREASLPIDVVLPTPLTPMMSSTIGLVSCMGSARRMSVRISFSASRAFAGSPIFSEVHFSRSRPTASSVVAMPTSAMMRMSVRSS